MATYKRFDQNSFNEGDDLIDLGVSPERERADDDDEDEQEVENILPGYNNVIEEDQDESADENMEGDS